MEAAHGVCLSKRLKPGLGSFDLGLSVRLACSLIRLMVLGPITASGGENVYEVKPDHTRLQTTLDRKNRGSIMLPGRRPPPGVVHAMVWSGMFSN